MVAAAAQGRIVQVIGSTFDAEFEEGQLPEIYNALKVDSEYKGVHIRLTGEVQQHLGGGKVRALAEGRNGGSCQQRRSSKPPWQKLQRSRVMVPFITSAWTGAISAS